MVLVILVGLVGMVAGCGEVLMPTPTALPLAATATAVRRPTPLPTAPAPSATATSQAAAEPEDTPSPAATGEALLKLDDLLVERTVQDFLARLAAGDAEAALRLYVTDQARTEVGDTLRPLLLAGEPHLSAASLVELIPGEGGSYQARAVLQWAGQAEGAGSQNMVLGIVPDAGLWRIQTVALGSVEAPAPTATTPAAGRSQAAALAGRLVFQVSSGGAIYGINADGTGLQRLTDGLDPAWSPDGTRIALSRWRTPWGVYTMRADGSGEERVVDGNQIKEVAWSPDGKRLAFTINYSSAGGGQVCFFGFCFTLPPYSVGQIWTANLESGEFLSLPLDDKAVHAPAWDPAGERLVYAGDRGLAWIDLADLTRKGVFGGGSAWDTSPAFSPDGSHIAFMGRVHNRWEIFVMNADGSGRTQLTHSDPDLEPAPSNVAPAWSPDGRHLAFLSSRDGPWRIYVMKADGSGQRSMFGSALDKLGIRYEWASERVMSWAK